MKSKIGESQAVTNELTSVHYTKPTYTELQEGYEKGGGTTTPTQVTIAECKAIGLNAITLNWNRQNNLTNWDHDEAQVSDNQSDWYSLRNDGVDWKGTLGAVTTVYNHYITHENIPPGGTEDDPTALTLYYRVRRVTKEPVNGDWSTSASATTHLLATGDILAKAIAEAKLDDQAVVARTIAATALNWPEDAEAYWPFDEGTDAAAKEVRNGHDGTIVGASWTDGPAGGALSFTKNLNHRVDSDGWINNVTGSFSVAAWVYVGAAPDGNGRVVMATFHNNGGGGAERGWFLGNPWGSSDFAQFKAYGSDGAILINLVEYDFWATYSGQWVHLVAVFQPNDTCTLYINGISATSDTSTGSLGTDSSNNFSIGTRPDNRNANTTWDGKIAEPRVYNRALSAAEVKTLYQFKRPGTGLVIADRIAAGIIEAAHIAARTIVAGKLSLNTLTADEINTNTLEALFAKIAYALTIGYGGTGSKDDPDTGDRRTYIDDDELAIQRYNGSSWIDRIRLGYQIMKAYDENAVCIHDIPDAAILSDMVYGGHIMWRDAPTYVGQLTQTYTDTQTTRQVTSAVQNSDITSDIPTNLTNAKGALIHIRQTVNVDSNKAAQGSQLMGDTKFSKTYNTTPPANNHLLSNLWMVPYGSLGYGGRNSCHVLIPITHNGGNSYLTWNNAMNFLNMASGNGTYYITTTLYLLGVFV